MENKFYKTEHDRWFYEVEENESSINLIAKNELQESISHVRIAFPHKEDAYRFSAWFADQLGLGWVSVSERLPEKDSTEVWETYLCKLNRYGEILIAPLWFIGGSFYSGYSVKFDYTEFVTDWRPLPTHPEVSE